VDQNLIVISKAEEIRSSFLDSYTLLGYEVKVFDDILEVIRDLNFLEPDHVVMDIDELARKWKVVASGLKLAQKKITIILLVSAMSLEQANEALLLGVSGIIIKPFLREFHLKRVYDIIHRKLRAEGKRIYPRFYAGNLFEGALIARNPLNEQLHVFELINVCEIGAAVRTRDLAAFPELQPGYVLEDGVLRIDNQEFQMRCQVVFRQQGLIGVGFRRIKKGKANFLRFIQKLSLKAFDISGIKGKW
jgi:DNA-binding response OmpR family regulator